MGAQSAPAASRGSPYEHKSLLIHIIFQGAVLLLPSAAGTSVLSDKADAATTKANQPLTGNVLDNASIPPGSTATVSGFSIAGSTRVLSPGTTTTLTNPVTGMPTGTLVLRSDASYTFTPASGYVGPVPAINVNVLGSTGQTATSSLTIDVLPRELTTPYLPLHGMPTQG